MRFWEIDFCRGVAVILMVFFNYAFALQYFGIYSLDAGWLFWWLFPRAIAGAFIFIAGLSLSISYFRMKDKKLAGRKYLSRGLKIFSLGLLVTFATYAFVPSAYVVFGILHFLGFAVAVSPLFLRMRSRGLLVSVFLSLILGIYLGSFTVGFPWFLWLGFAPDFYTLDYFPVLPWLGIFLFGMVSGRRLYAGGKRTFTAAKERSFMKPIVFLGRRSLMIYMLHMPALIASLLLLGYAVF